MAGPAPFARYLPYWTTLAVPWPEAAAPEPAHRGPAASPSVLLLKDGTLAVGVALGGLDVYAAEAAALNRCCEVIAEALGGLPAGMFAQIVYESGDDFAPLLAHYAAQSAAGSHPLLRQGRVERRAMLQRCPYLTRCRITLWLGQRRALPSMAAAAGPAGSRLLQRLVRRGTGPGRRAVDVAAVRAAAHPLLEQTDTFLAILGRAGLAAEMMDERAVLSACHRAINPMHSRHDATSLGYVRSAADLKAYQSGAALVLPGPTLAAQLPLSALRYNDTQLVLGEPPLVLRVLGAAQLGPTTNPKSLHPLLYDDLPKTPMRLVITHEATDTQLRREQLARRQRFISSFIGAQFVDHGARAAVQEHDEVLGALELRGGRLFETSLLVVVSGRDVEQVERASRQVIDGLGRQRIGATVHHEEQLTAWLATLPAYGTQAPHKHTLLSHNCAHLWPFWLPSMGDAQPDLLFENRQRGIEALSVRLGPVRENAGAIIVGATNSGKTFLFSTLFKYGCLDLGGHVVLADIKGPTNSSYRPLCALLGGTYVSLEQAPDISFNPLPPRDEVFAADGAFLPAAVEGAERILCMMTVPKGAVGPDAAYARSIARDVIKAAYLAAAAAQKNTKQQSGVVAQVVLSDLLAAFGSYQGRNAKLRGLARSMAERLEFWVEDPTRARLFNQPKSLDLSDRFIVFDFYNMDKDKELAAVLISVLTSRIEAKMTQLPKTTPKLFGFDEAWALFQQSAAACALLDRLYRVARSYGAFCYVLTQSYADIEASAAKMGIMANSSLVYLMRHMAHHRQTAQALELTGRQEELFRSLEMVAGRFAEFLLIDKHEDKTHLLQYAPTGFDLWCDTSRPADVAYRQQAIDASDVGLVQTIEALAQRHPRGAPDGAEAPGHAANTPNTNRPEAAAGPGDQSPTDAAGAARRPARRARRPAAVQP